VVENDQQNGWKKPTEGLEESNRTTEKKSIEQSK
jgi:hypothetical protein